MKKYKFNVCMEVRIDDITILANSEEEAIEDLKSCDLDYMARNGFVSDETIVDYDFETIDEDEEDLED